MDMAATAGEVLIPLRHEAGEQALPRGHDLHHGLEERGLIGGAKHVIVANGCLIHAGSGLRMESFELDIHRPAGVQDGVG